jgi:hypothetical protein
MINIRQKDTTWTHKVDTLMNDIFYSHNYKNSPYPVGSLGIVENACKVASLRLRHCTNNTAQQWVTCNDKIMPITSSTVIFARARWCLTVVSSVAGGTPAVLTGRGQ